VGHEAVRFDNPLLPDTRSEMALPLVAGDRVLGALDVQSAESAAFSQQDIAVLQLVADQVAVAIANARLFATVQSALEAERRAYGEIGRESWAQLSRTQAALGYYSDEHGVSPAAEGGAPEAGGPWLPETEAEVKAGRTVVTAGDAETALVPIKVRDEVIGMIDAHKPRGTGRWTADEISVLETLTDQLGVALDSARLHQATQRRVVQEQLTAEVTARIRQTLDVDSVLRTAVQEMGAALGLGKVEVRLGQPGRQEQVTHGGDDWPSQSGGQPPSKSDLAGAAPTEGVKGDGDGVTN